MSPRAGIVFVFVALLSAGCSSGDDDDAGGGGGRRSIAAAVGALPAPSGDAPATVAFGDLAQAADLAGVDVSEVDADGDDPQPVLEALNAITGNRSSDETGLSPVAAITPAAAHVERLADIREFVDEVGWHVLQVDRFVEYQVPPNNVTVMEGRFDEALLTEALGEPDDRVWVIGNPDGSYDVSATSPARPLGEPLWLSLLDGDRLVVSRTAEGMEAVRSSGGGTLGDDDALMALADALDAEDVYSALLHNAPLIGVGIRPTTPEQAEDICGESLPERVSAVATGIAHDGEPVIVLAYVHASDDAAEANAEAVDALITDGASIENRRPWSETFEVDSIDTDGNVTVARLRMTDGTPPAIWRQLLLARDNLVSSC